MSNRTAAACLLVLIAGGEVVAASRWIRLSSGEMVVGLASFLLGAVALTTFVFRSKYPIVGYRGTRWLFRPRSGLSINGGWGWTVGAAVGVAATALLPLGALLVAAAFLCGLGLSVVALGVLALARGHVQ